jgi:hypothetical protein
MVGFICNYDKPVRTRGGQPDNLGHQGFANISVSMMCRSYNCLEPPNAVKKEQSKTSYLLIPDKGSPPVSQAAFDQAPVSPLLMRHVAHNVLTVSSKSSSTVAIVSDLLGRVDRPKLAALRPTTVLNARLGRVLHAKA